VLDHHYDRADPLGRAEDVAEKDAEDAFFIGLTAHLLLVLTVLVWSMLHM